MSLLFCVAQRFLPDEGFFYFKIPGEKTSARGYLTSFIAAFILVVISFLSSRFAVVPTLHVDLGVTEREMRKLFSLLLCLE